MDKVKTKRPPINKSTQRRPQTVTLKTPDSESRRVYETPQWYEQKYRSLFELSPVAMMILDMKGTVTACNAAVSRLSGYAEDTILGKHFSRLPLFKTADTPRYTKLLTAIMKGKLPELFEAMYHRKDGAHRWAGVSASPLKIGTTTIGMQLLVSDITERKLLHDKLLLRNEIVDNTTEGIVVVQASDNVILYCNPRFCEMFGYSPGELLGKNMANLNAPINVKSPDEFGKEIAESIHKNGLWNGEIARRRKDGSIFWSMVSISSMESNQYGTVWIGSHKDITSQKQMEHDLLERIKELNCLHGISKITDKSSLTLDELYKEVLTLIPAGWQYPEITCAKLITDDKVFKTKNYRNTMWKLSSDIKVSDQKAGMLEVSYLEEKPESDEGPFLKEERFLLNTITERLGQITARKESEEALQKSEHKLKKHLESAPDGVYLSDLKGTFLYGNIRTEEIIGYRKEELIGKNFLKLNLLPTKYLAKAAKLLARNAMGKSTGPDEFELIRKDKSTVKVEITTAPVKDAEGKIEVIGFVRDITERKRMEEALRGSEERYRHLFENLNDAAFLADVETGMIIETNQQGMALLGRSHDEIVGMHQSELHPPGKADEYRQKFDTHIQKGRVADYVGEVIREDGTIVPVRISAATLTIHGQPLILGLFHDITERKQAEEALADEATRRRILIEQSRDGIVILDQNGKVYESNQRFAEMLGYSPEEVLHLHVWDFGALATREQLLEMLGDVDEAGDHFETQHRRKDGTLYDVEISTNGAVFAGQKLIFCVCRDITERKRMEEALKERNEQLDAQNEEIQSQSEELLAETQELVDKTRKLEKANVRLKEIDHLKSVFLASMSHELRTPLNSIIGFTSLILQGMVGEINEEQREQLSLVLNSANHLLSLINDVLDISKVEAGKVELVPEKFKLADVVREVADICSPGTNLKGIDIFRTVPENITLYSDKKRVKQILMNLASNAVKFTEKGNVSIVASVSQDGNVSISVTDTGIGMRKKDIAKLFNPFQQVNMSLTKKYEGTGLGLHITKKLVDLLGGKISVVSRYGKGSKFTVTIPVKIHTGGEDEENPGSR